MRIFAALGQARGHCIQPSDRQSTSWRSRARRRRRAGAHHGRECKCLLVFPATPRLPIAGGLRAAEVHFFCLTLVGPAGTRSLALHVGVYAFPQLAGLSSSPVRSGPPLPVFVRSSARPQPARLAEDDSVRGASAPRPLGF
jgi:hypothetical protein